MLTTYHLIPHVRDKQRYDNLVGRGYVIPLFGYGHRDNTRYKGKANCDIFSGYTVFHPACLPTGSMRSGSNKHITSASPSQKNGNSGICQTNYQLCIASGTASIYWIIHGPPY